MAVSRKFVTVGAVGVAAFALIGAGASATFTNSGTANANIDTGTFSCQLTSTNSAVEISNGGRTATVNLGTISSSAKSSKTAPVIVTNTGAIPLATTWSVMKNGNLGSKFSAIPAAGNDLLGAGDAQTVNIGFSWAELVNDDLGRSGNAVYTVSCNEVANPAGVQLFQQDGGLASWDSAGNAVLNIPTGVDPLKPVNAGIEILNVPAELPATAPVFVTDDAYTAGSPRLVIELSNGGNVFGYPSQVGSLDYWTLPGSGAGTNWAAVKAYANGGNPASTTLTVAQAYIVADGSSVGTAPKVSCVNYSGTPLFGTGC